MCVYIHIYAYIHIYMYDMHERTIMYCSHDMRTIYMYLMTWDLILEDEESNSQRLGLFQTIKYPIPFKDLCEWDEANSRCCLGYRTELLEDIMLLNPEPPLWSGRLQALVVYKMELSNRMNFSFPPPFLKSLSLVSWKLISNNKNIFSSYFLYKCNSSQARVSSWVETNPMFNFTLLFRSLRL